MAAGRVASPAAKPTAPGVYLDETATVEAGAAIEHPTVIGPGCTIRAGATVARSLLWDGVTVDAEASIADSILATGVTIGRGAHVDHSVVAHEATIQPLTSLQGERIDPDGHPATTQPAAGTGTP